MAAVPISSTLDGSRDGKRRPWHPRGPILGISRRPKRIWIFAAVLNLLVAFTAAERILGERSEQLERAEERTRLVATVLKAHLERIFDLANANLKSLDEIPETGPLMIDRNRLDLPARLDALVSTGRAFVNLLIVDANGHTVAGGKSDRPLPTDLSDRAYFQRHRVDPSPDLLISEPVRSRPSNLIIVPISRRLENRQGAFDGIVVAGLRADHLIDLYRSLEPLSVSAHLLDGTTLARAPESTRVAQRLAEDDPVMGHLALLPSGTFETEAGNRPRIVSYSSLDRWPVMVAVEVDRAAALAGWRASRDGTILLALLFAATVIGAFFVIERQITALAAARIAAEAADRAKSHFLAHMSHELRTPLNAVIGFAEIMEQEVFGELGNRRYRQYARDIHLSGEHLLSTINNILDLAKVSAGHWKVDQRLVAPAEVVANLRHLLVSEAEARKVAFTIDLAPDLPTLVSDRRMIAQILVNTIGCAIRATPPEGRVHLTVAASEATLVFKVSDTGPGMSAEEIRSAQQPLADAETALTAKNRDTGLTLPLARAFAELLGGRLHIASDPGRGTVVTVVLPLGNISLSEENWRARRDSNS